MVRQLNQLHSVGGAASKWSIRAKNSDEHFFWINQKLYILRVSHFVQGRFIDEQFSKALDLVGNGHFVFGAENKYLLALRDVLKESVNDQYDYIDWWLYEATDDYTVWEADCTMKYCLKEPEALYDYITGMLKPIPVSSGESTS